MKVILLTALLGFTFAQELKYGHLGPQRNYLQPRHVQKFVEPAFKNPVVLKADAEKEAPKPFSFSYKVNDEFGNEHHREETGDEAGHVQGNYGYTDANGIYRQVEYTANDYGFKASLKTNEPGTGNFNPADVEIYADPAPISYDEPKKIERTRKVVQLTKPANSYVAPSAYSGPAVAHRSGYILPNSNPTRQVTKKIVTTSTNQGNYGFRPAPVVDAPYVAPRPLPYADKATTITKTYKTGYIPQQKHYGHLAEVVARRPY